jgi:ATP-binding cassette, subfamily B, bacterial
MPPPAVPRWSVTGLLVSRNLLEDTPPVRLRTIFRRFWPETRPFRGRVWASLLFVAAGPLLSAATIWLFKILVDDVLTPHSFRHFPALAAAYVGISVLEGVVSFSDQYLSTWVGERFVLNLRSRLFTHLHQQSSQFFERHELGDSLSRLTGDISAIEQLVLSGLAEALTYVFQLVFFTAALFYLSWQMALASLIAAPGFLLIARIFSRRIKDASREQRRRASSITTVAEESFSNAALVRAYDRRASESARFDEENLGSFTAQMTATRLQALFGPLTELLQVVGVLLVIGLAVWELTNNAITLGGLLVFVAYLTQLYGPLQGLGQLTNSLFAASASAERVMELLDLAPTITEPTRPVPLRRARGYLRVREVSFAYPDTDSQTLGGINLEVRPGQRVAIVGASGAGKSTLAKLLLRFYDPSHGSISLDGTDLRDLSEADLRRNIATVLQETLVFDGTIRENIAWGRPEATAADIVAAATAADAHEFITALPEGYDSRIGQRGRLLSGGQRQRLAIARAMIRDAPVLLLDEPTTGLDAESTRRVLEPLRRLMAGRTTVIISHNLLTVTDADLIVLLDHGRIRAAGTHRELLTTSPGYARLYHLHQTPPALQPPQGLAEIRTLPLRRPSPRPRPTPVPR